MTPIRQLNQLPHRKHITICRLPPAASIAKKLHTRYDGLPEKIEPTREIFAQGFNTRYHGC